MSAGDVLLRLYLPLLTQEGGIMVSTFTLGLRDGVSGAALVGINTAAVMTDLALVFVPSYVFARRMRARSFSRLRERYEARVRRFTRFGTFWIAAVAAFAMPSVTAMIIVGFLRLPFWRALAGLLVGSATYVVIPLLVASPLAATLPAFLVPVLQWAVPALVVLYVLAALIRWKLADLR